MRRVGVACRVRCSNALVRRALINFMTERPAHATTTPCCTHHPPHPAAADLHRIPYSWINLGPNLCRLSEMLPTSGAATPFPGRLSLRIAGPFRRQSRGESGAAAPRAVSEWMCAQGAESGASPYSMSGTPGPMMSPPPAEDSMGYGMPGMNGSGYSG
ncbi:hypothetical protein C7M84_004531, partial [Penaeus vannamei]